MLACGYTGSVRQIECGCLIPVTSRLPEDSLWQDLQAMRPDWAQAGVTSVAQIGDCLAPGLIAAAVYSGHKHAREACGQVAVAREDVVPLEAT